MKSLSAHVSQRRAALVAICGVLFAVAAVPVALAAAPEPKTGYYKSAKGQRSPVRRAPRVRGRA